MQSHMQNTLNTWRWMERWNWPKPDNTPVATFNLITLVMPLHYNYYHKVGTKDDIKSLLSEDKYKIYNYQVINDVYHGCPMRHSFSRMQTIDCTLSEWTGDCHSVWWYVYTFGGEAISSHVGHQTNTEIIQSRSVGSSYLFWIHGRVTSVTNIIFCLQYACVWILITSYIGLWSFPLHWMVTVTW